MMDRFEVTSHSFRRARTRSLIQLGALIETAGLLDTFEITLGSDLQKDPAMKRTVAALFKGLLELNTMAKTGDLHMPLMAEQGLKVFGELREERS